MEEQKTEINQEKSKADEPIKPFWFFLGIVAIAIMWLISSLLFR